MFSTIKNPVFTKIYAIPLVLMIVQHMSGAIAILYAIELKADILQINLITTIQATMGILFLVPFGILSDRFGRKPMVLYPRIVMIVGDLIRALATNPNHLLLASLAGGFAGGAFFPVLLSMIGDVAKPEEQHVAISTLFLFSSIGMLIGPIICSFLLTLHQMSLRNIYQIVVVAQICVFIFIATQIQETKPRRMKGEEAEYHFGELLRQTGFLGLLIMVFLFFFSFAIINTYIPIYARVFRGLSNAEVASFSTYRSLAIMLIRLSSATFLNRAPIRLFLPLSLTLGGVACLAAPLARNYLSMVLIIFLFGISFGAVRILSSTLVAKNSTPENRGIANSLLNVAMSTGNITQIFTSPIATSLGFTPVFILGGLTALTSIIPSLRYR